MSGYEFLLLLCSVMASSLGQFFLKAGALQLGEVTATNAVSHVLNIVRTPPLIMGLATYALGAVAYILLLTRVNLSVAAPAVSLIYLITVLVGHFVFKEHISLVRVMGLAFIMTGVVMVTSR